MTVEMLLEVFRKSFNQTLYGVGFDTNAHSAAVWSAF